MFFYTNYGKSFFLLIIVFFSSCAGNSGKKELESKVETVETDSIKLVNKKDDSISFGYFTPDGDSLIISSFEIR